MMEISYIRKDGCAGKMRFEESVFLPVLSARDFKKILDVIAMSDKWEEHVMQLNDFINSEIERITGERDKSKNAKITAKLNTELKKWIGFNAALVKAFQVEEKTDAEAKIRCKKTVVYIVKANNGKPGIEAVDGYSFEKFGRIWHVYKAVTGRWSEFKVIMPENGLIVATGKTKNEAIAALTKELIDRIFNLNENKLSQVHETFIKLMHEAGLENALENEVYARNTETEPETDKPKIEEPEKKSPRPIETEVNAADHAERVPAPEQDTLKSPTPIIKAVLPGSPRLYRDRVPYKRDIRVLNSPRLLYRLIHITGSYIPHTRALYTPCTPARSIRPMYHKRNAPHYIDTS